MLKLNMFQFLNIHFLKNLNTSHVKVKRAQTIVRQGEKINLNTSHVKVKQRSDTQ
mgnify:CR=1 FL=1